MARDIRTVGVIGLGTMGAGIAEVAARAGLDVVGVEVDNAGVERGRASIVRSSGRAVSGDSLTEEEQAALLGRISCTTELEDLARCQLVIEAVPDRLELKREIFGKLGTICEQDTILATNTSIVAVTEIAVATGHPHRIIGLHFSNPAPEAKLVEVVRTAVVEQDVVDDAVAFVEKLEYQPVVVGDKPGFIVSALLFPYLNHAVQMYEAKYATREDIDAGMRFGCGLPMGPLAVVDLVGLDTTYAVLDAMHQRSGLRVHAPSPILKQMITGGLNGRKSGKGFYTYDQPGSGKVVADARTPKAGASGAATREISKVGVLGSGTMASGIVEVFAKSGYEVVFVARKDDRVARVNKNVDKSLGKGVQRGKLTQEAMDATQARITGSTSMDAFADVDIVIEAVAEDLSVKQALFSQLDAICKPGAILATTTSSLPVVECAAVTSRPGDVVGMHFFNPAPVMRLVEVVTTVSTAEDVVATVTELSKKVGKVPVLCPDVAGFIVNALLFPYLNDAVTMLAEHYASADDIDLAIKTALGYPMGPFALLDVVGNDVSLAIEQTLYAEFREPGFVPARLLEQLVTAGYMGRKTGRGFRSYNK